MQCNTPTQSSVNNQNGNVPDHAPVVAWGARAIGEIIGRTERQAHHMLEKGLIKSARKTGGRWNAGVSTLRGEFGI